MKSIDIMDAVLQNTQLPQSQGNYLVLLPDWVPKLDFMTHFQSKNVYFYIHHSQSKKVTACYIFLQFQG